MDILTTVQLVTSILFLGISCSLVAIYYKSNKDAFRGWLCAFGFCLVSILEVL